MSDQKPSPEAVEVATSIMDEAWSRSDWSNETWRDEKILDWAQRIDEAAAAIARNQPPMLIVTPDALPRGLSSEELSLAMGFAAPRSFVSVPEDGRQLDPDDVLVMDKENDRFEVEKPPDNSDPRQVAEYLVDAVQDAMERVHIKKFDAQAQLYILSVLETEVEPYVAPRGDE